MSIENPDQPTAEAKEQANIETEDQETPTPDREQDLRDQIKQAEEVDDEESVLRLEAELRVTETGEDTQADVEGGDFGEKNAEKSEDISEKPELVKYIKETREQGFSDSQIREALIDAGHSEIDVERLMNTSPEELQENTESTGEESAETLVDIEKESELLGANLEQLKNNTEAVGSFSAETLSENEGALNKLGEKITGIFSRITERLSNIEAEKLMIPGALVGIAAAAINIAGVSELSGYLQYLPDTIQQFINSPEAAGSMIWSVISESGHFAGPSLENYTTQAAHAQEVFNTDIGGHIENAHRIASGLVNITTGFAVGLASFGIGNVLKTWAQAKERAKEKFN